MPDIAPNASQDFMRIVTPSGKVGFVPAEAINPLGSDQLCYGKDAAGAWKIVGMIGGGIAAPNMTPGGLIPRAPIPVARHSAPLLKQV